MRRLLFLLGAAFFLSPPARAADCAGVGFADMLWVRFAKAPGAVAFTGGKSRIAVARGELLALGVISDAQVCAEALKSGRSGWLPNDSLEKIVRINDTGSFVGDWRRGAAALRIDWRDDGRLIVEATGAGSVAGDMDMRDGVGLFYGEGVDPENMEAPGCRVRMARGGELLLVRDNGQCGGGLAGTYASVRSAARAK
ncbi:hypothetical protein SAMN06265338_10787 [Rhodoblastus acidophilus]|uniref:SH3 domain-containing protein n=1 Tax=Rhodoblastus acidophilus TaxID=1074 RepID=A0A212RTM7_RHOAC|nr:hypothetical protein [Rhodoblastus acidophilus]PPQ37379.1 hypothetical protein CKO16_14575 [Rhodoblastus acidophilus]RAI23165.1 hypothetical protein CH337_03850 [Rhodoblastus acidophilus]SNB76037.1 hypothetical protein SAMN06265338_10787 [Rhodoblastus acidophilus]